MPLVKSGPNGQPQRKHSWSIMVLSLVFAAVVSGLILGLGISVTLWLLADGHGIAVQLMSPVGA